METTAKLWQAVADQAQVWSTLKPVVDVRDGLPKNTGRKENEVAIFIQNLTAGHARVMTNPLRLGSIVLNLRQQDMALGASPPEKKLNDWLDAAIAVELAHQDSMAWLRSRLPSYPLILAPQLVSGTQLRTLEWTPQVPWTIEEQRQGLQFLNGPQGVSQRLHLDSEQTRRADESIRVVSEELIATDQWQRFNEATTGLSDADKTELRTVRTRLAKQLTDRAIDEYEPGDSLRRQAYREHTTADALNSLDGNAHEYAASFGAVNALLDFVSSDVFGQLALYGTPRILPIADLEMKGKDDGIAFTALPELSIFSRLAELAWLDDPLISDAVQIRGSRFTFDGISTKVSSDAIILKNTSVGWNRATA